MDRRVPERDPLCVLYTATVDHENTPAVCSRTGTAQRTLQENRPHAAGTVATSVREGKRLKMRNSRVKLEMELSANKDGTSLEEYQKPMLTGVYRNANISPFA
ncbi:hypothetical protein BaRGS_00033890 [Batillaria attramentaria]|uniref:Uncharacterized protein n=1 Tax=Batillaria attramentaria TaxID=370345 RepID=A0ABD0JIL7_9CAEN